MSIARTSNLDLALSAELSSPSLDKRAAAAQAQPLKTPGKKPKTVDVSPFEVVLKPLTEDGALSTVQDNFSSLAGELEALKAQVGGQADPTTLLERICDKVNFLQAQLGQMPPDATLTLWGYAAKAHRFLSELIVLIPT